MITVDASALSQESHEQVEVECDSQVSERCYRIYKRAWRDIRKTRERNGRDICLPCSRRTKASGRNNPNARYKDLDDFYFQDIDTPVKAWMLGWIASDGCLSHPNTIDISIISTDSYILDAIGTILHCGQSYTVKQGHMSTININSRQMANDVRRHLGLPRPEKKSKIVQFPQLSNQLESYFIRGLFEGDGCLHYSKPRNYLRFEIASSSPQMKAELFRFFQGGYVNEHQWSLQGTKAVKAIKELYENTPAAPILTRKHEKYKNYTGPIYFRK